MSSILASLFYLGHNLEIYKFRHNLLLKQLKYFLNMVKKNNKKSAILTIFKCTNQKY